MPISMLSLVRISPFLLTLWTTSVAAVCYLRNGSDINEQWGNGDRYASCNPGGSGASMCCSINGGGDSCAPIYANNPSLALCSNQDYNLLWRESCTDQPWLSVNCVKLFMNVTDQDITVTNCSAYNLGEGFCYGDRNTGCCKAGEAVFIDPISGEQVATNPALSSSSSTSTTLSTSSPTSTPESSPSSTASSSSGLSSGAKAGIGIGVSLGVVALLLVAGIVLFRKRRNSKPQPSAVPAEPYQSYYSGKAELNSKPKYSAVSELGGDERERGQVSNTRPGETDAAELAG